MRERVWDEGYEVGYDDAIFDQRGLSTDSDADQYPHENPYRGLESADIDVAALRAAAEGAHDEIVRLCSAREDWRMSIPANPERDSDLIFDAVVNQIPALLDRLAVAEAAMERASSALDDLALSLMSTSDDNPTGNTLTAAVVSKCAAIVRQEQP